jgi:glutathione synthase/RimK-type ligase-like ATP-grasp enzyme
MEKFEPDDEMKALAIRAAEVLKLDFAGVDVLFGNDGPYICEVNSNAHFKNLYDCTGVNTADHILQHIKDSLG